MDNISDVQVLETYLGELKEDIQHELFLKHLKNVMEAMQFSRHI